MKKILLLLIAVFGIAVTSVRAAVFTAEPYPLQEASKNVVITFHADECDVAGLKNLNTDLYAHIGVFTTKSPSAWAYVKTDWSENVAANTFKRVAANTYQLTIGDMRTYFGINDATEKITKICVIARTATGTAQTKDYFIDVFPEGLQLAFESTPENTVLLSSTNITFNAYVTDNADISIYLNNELKKAETGQTKLSYSQTFSQQGGSWEVKAVAKKGSEIKESVINVIYLKPSPQQNHPKGNPKANQGAVKNADGTVTFCVAAPDKSNVVLVGSWDGYKPLDKNIMKYQDYNGYRYFWTTVSGLENSTYYPYYYLVDGKYKVGDPYTHLALDYNSDKWLFNESSEDVFPDRPKYPYDIIDDAMMGVYKGDLDDYNWSKASDNFKIADRNSMVIYELLLRDFTGTSSTADGTVRGAIEKIPYLKSLGVSAVELMPIMEFDGNNSWGYNTNFYMAPDKSYGSPDDYKEFIDRCHQEGIAVILDIVLNHTPGLHPWYAMYEPGTSPFYNKTAPHSYSVYNDIKQEYPLVEEHWKDVLKYWMTVYRVDGFRFDLVKGLGDSSSYGSGGDANTNKDNQSRIDRMKRLHAYMKTINPNVIHINEDLAGTGEETQLGNDGQLQWNKQNPNSGEYARGTAADLSYFLSTNCSRPAFSTVDYAESHDEERLGYTAKKNGVNATIKSSESNRMKRLGSVAAQMLMTPGPKMIWQFGELGNEQTTKNGSDNNTDAKEVHWEYLDNANRAALHDNYKALCWLRRDNPEMFSDGTTCTYTGFNSTSGRSIKLTNGNKEIIAFINPSISSSAGVQLSGTKITPSNYKVIATSKGFTPTLQGNATRINVQVPANSFCVLATKDIAGVDEITIDDSTSKNSVYGASGRIVIVGEYDNVEVYNMAGMRMGSLEVTSGIYIVNVDGQVHKVIVK